MLWLTRTTIAFTAGTEEVEVDSEEDKKRRNRAAAQRCRLKKKKQVCSSPPLFPSLCAW